MAEQPATRDRRALQGIPALGHNDLPSGGPGGEPRVDRDDASVGRVEVGTGDEHGALVAENGQLRDILVDDSDDQSAEVRLHRVAEIGNEKPGLRVGALVQRDDQVATIVGDASADEVVRQLLAPVDESVLALPGPDAVVVNLMVLQPGLERLAGRWFGKARIEEALAILRPRYRREAEPAHDIEEVLASRDLAHVDFGPVGAAFGQRVGKVAPVG